MKPGIAKDYLQQISCRRVVVINDFYIENFLFARRFYGLNLFGNIIEAVLLCPGDIYHHIDFVCPVEYRLLSLGDFNRCCRVAERETDNGADINVFIFFVNVPDKTGRNTYRRCAVFQ